MYKTEFSQSNTETQLSNFKDLHLQTAIFINHSVEAFYAWDQSDTFSVVVSLQTFSVLVWPWPVVAYFDLQTLKQVDEHVKLGQCCHLVVETLCHLLQ